MSDFYSFSADTGIVIPDTIDVRDKVIARFKEKFGPNVSTEEETHIGRLIDEITEVVTQTTGVNAENANQFNLNYATGKYLDDHGILYGIERTAASRTLVTGVKFTANTNGVTVPAGAIVGIKDGDTFEVVESVTLGETESVPDENGQPVTMWYGIGNVEATNTGRIACPAGKLTEIYTSVLGWVGVSNPSSTYVMGCDVETDDHYRKRLKSARANGIGSVQAIRNAVFASQKGITSVEVLENGYGYTRVIKKIVVPPHSIYVCVAGATDYDLVAKAIYESKTAGCGYTMSSDISLANRISRTVTDPNTNVQYDVYFFIPEAYAIDIEISVDLSGYTGVNLVSSMKEKLEEYLAEQGIGGIITDESITSVMTAAFPSIVIDDVRIYDSTDISHTNELLKVELASNRTFELRNFNLSES